MRQVNDFLRVIVCFLFSATLYKDAAAQTRTDSKLEKKITDLVKGFHGDVGVYVKNLRTGKVSIFQADTIFPTASMVKIPIMVGMMDKIEKGELGYHQELIYKDSLLYAGSDMLGSYKSGEKIEVGKAMLLMLSTSDNTASLWLQSLAGGGARIGGGVDMSNRERLIPLGLRAEMFPAGTHMCYLYNDDDERHRMISGFIAGGLREHEKVGYFVDLMSPEEMRGRLRELGVDMPPETGPQELAIARALDTYCPDGRFVPERMLQNLRAMHTSSIDEGYAGARATGEMT